MIVVLSSVRGAPGVTSWTLLLASAWPHGVDVVVLEADGDGGVLACRYGLGVEPGVAALVAAVRRHDPRSGAFELGGFARRVGERVRVIPSPESAERAAGVWGSSVDEVAAVAARDERVWLVDGGRVSRGAWSGHFAARADLAVVVSGPSVEELLPIPARLSALQAAGAAAVGVLLVGTPPYPRAELQDFFGTALVWTVRPVKGLASLADQALQPGRARRTWAWREAVSVAGSMADAVSAWSAHDAPVEVVAGDD